MPTERATSRHFQIAAASLPGLPDVAIPIAAARAAGLGILDLEYTTDVRVARQAISHLAEYARGRCGIRLDAASTSFAEQILHELPRGIEIVVLSRAPRETLDGLVEQLHQAGRTVWLQATSVADADVGQELGVDALVAKGHEAAGRVQDETTFVLLQRLLHNSSLPIWAEGGIGCHTAAACYAAGAAGIILSSQLALTRESALPEATRAVIARTDGSETVLLGEELQDPHRVYARARLPVIEHLQSFARDRAIETPDHNLQAEWRRELHRHLGWDAPEQSVWLIGQDAAFARAFAERYQTVGGVIAGLRQAISEHVEAARTCTPLAENSPLAQSLGTRYPIAQGPMTRVSDRATFAEAVADGGGLPFLALSLLRAEELQTLFQETQQLLGEHPWGVGILGFVPLELRQEQLEVIRQFRPPYALIAGGRPDQAHSLERDGIPTFLHVPSPNLLKLFLEAGTRRFVFEGRECGGHVGPRTSFVLWELMIDVLLDSLTDQQLSECHILFAGGVHDALSASMISCLAARLAERGAKIGVLMGTAYTMTTEAVTSGAIVKGFQEEALRCSHTRLLETGPGHATRCADTQFARTFADEKRSLIAAGKAAEEVRDSLEELNLGRLRIATKGVDRNAQYRQDPAAPKLVEVDETTQHSGGMYMIGQVAALRDKVCTIAELHADVSTASTQRLESIDAATSLDPAADQPGIEVAIIGMSCVLPKAPDLQTYWDNILDEVYAITEVPASRWDADLYFDADRNAPDKTYSKWGGFIDPVEFNPLDFGMPPNSLPSIDPLQLLALKAARDAIDDAGYRDRPFDRAATSVILGASGGLGDLGTGYAVRSTLPAVLGAQGHAAVAAAGERLPTWTEDSFAGLLPNVAAGRISNRLDLGGLNFVVDAACASSLAAVNLAVNELQSGNSNMVVVGGVDTIQSPFGFMCFAKTQALSPHGRPRTFDTHADGIAIGEGVVMLVLKRLADAERDGDRVYAVIRGTAGSSDGKAMGLTAPRVEGQKQALSRAYTKAGISPASVGLYEAHGTGTVVGDRTEALALAEYLEQAGVESQGTAIGSVKSMIGHTKATAGVAGMAKIALALHHKVLPATLGVTSPNAEARLQDGPLYVNAQTRPWIRTPHRQLRRAGVSSFGFGGTNFHAILEEYPGDHNADQTATSQRWPSELFCWTSASRSDLVNQLQQLEAALDAGAQPRLPDLAAMLATRMQTAHPLRLAIVAVSLDELRTRIAAARAHLQQDELAPLQDPRGIYFSSELPDPDARLALLFPGQGSQSPNMLRDLALHFAEVRQAFERADNVLSEQFPGGLSSHVFPPPRFRDEDEQADRDALSQTNVAQPALSAASTAMLQLLRSLGVSPQMVAGHSYGEYVALFAGGAIDEATLHRISEARGRFIVESAVDDLGTMAAVTGGPDDVSAAIEGVDEVWIANCNAPQQTVISGSRAAIDQAVRQLEERGLRTKRFPVSCAFHSPLVAPARKRLAEFLKTCTFSAPSTAVFSNTTAVEHARDAATIVEQLSEHLTSPVRFVDEIEAMYAAGARTFVEVGPGSVLTGLTKRILAERPHVAIATDSTSRNGLVQLQHCLAQLVAAGVPLNLERLYRGRVHQSLEPGNLVETTRPAAPKPTTWLIDGGRARPLVDAAAATSPQSATFALQLEPVPAATHPAEPPAPASPPPPRTNVPSPASPTSPPTMSSSSENTTPSPTGQPAPPVGSTSSAVMLQYQELMTRFLQSQQQVMLSYLGGASAPETIPLATVAASAPAETQSTPAPVAPAMELPSAPPVAAESQTAAAQIPAATTPEVAAPAQPVVETHTPAVDADELTRQLLELVSDRTGYPTEMLDLDLDIEAELGIDSIKRVEILAMLQNNSMPEGWESGDSDMEELLKFKTMRGIVGWMADQANRSTAPVAASGGQTTTEVSAPTAATAAPAVDQEALTRQLLELVSDRTGYPTEMLDLDLDIEAELGIDSIKRVEILAMLQNNNMPEGWESGDSDMEELLKFKTMRGIVDWMAAQAGSTTASAEATLNDPPSPETTPPATARFSHDQLTRQLRELVSDRTGYPTEMLDLDLDIEAELGIDSIKRVEILAMLQNNSMPDGWESGDSDMEELLKFKTMRGIVDWMAASAGSASTSATVNGTASNGTPHVADEQTGSTAALQHPVAEPSAADAAVQAVPRFSYAMVDAPSALRDFPQQSEGLVIVTDDETGVADAVIQRLSQEGLAAVRVQCRDESREQAPGWYAVDLACSAAVDEFLAQLTTNHTRIAGILHLLPLRETTPAEELDIAGWERRTRQEVKGLFHLARAAAGDIRLASETGNTWVLAATRMGGALGSTIDPHGTPLFPGQGGIAGLIKTLALEWNQTHCKLLDFDAATAARPPLMSSLILDEMAQDACQEEAEIGYIDCERKVPRVTHLPLDARPGRILEIGAEAVILITGGARGITATIACDLAARYRPTIILAGRSAEPTDDESPETAALTSPQELKGALIEQLRQAGKSLTPRDIETACTHLLRQREMRANLARMRQLGARVEYHQVDVRDESAFGALIDSIYEAHGRIDGVIHGAGVIEDKLLVQKSDDSYDRVFETKTRSALVLSRRLRSESLRFLVFFSSMAGRFGNRGQSDYSASNEVLNKLALSLDRQWPARVVAINWGPWLTGMVSPEVQRQFAERGVQLIPPADGARVLHDELLRGTSGEVEIVLGDGPWKHLLVEEAPEATPTVMPLLGTRPSTINGSSVEIIRTLSIDEDRYLIDHKLDNRPVVPLAVAMEFMAEFVQQTWPDMKVVGIKSMSRLAGIILEEDTRDIRIVARPQTDPSHETLDLEVSVEICAVGRESRPAYRARVLLSDRFAEPPQFDLSGFDDLQPMPLSVDECYSQWLFHGPCFQGITSVCGVSKYGLVADISPSDPDGCLADQHGGRWLLDPVMIDCGFQLGLLWERLHYDMTPLPSSIASVRRFRESPRRQVRAYFVARPSVGGRILNSDIYILDADGRLAVLVENLQSACSKELNRLSARGVVSV